MNKFSHWIDTRLRKQDVDENGVPQIRTASQGALRRRRKPNNRSSSSDTEDGFAYIAFSPKQDLAARKSRQAARNSPLSPKSPKSPMHPEIQSARVEKGLPMLYNVRRATVEAGFNDPILGSFLTRNLHVDKGLSARNKAQETTNDMNKGLKRLEKQNNISDPDGESMYEEIPHNANSGSATNVISRETKGESAQLSFSSGSNRAIVIDGTEISLVLRDQPPSSNTRQVKNNAYLSMPESTSRSPNHKIWTTAQPKFRPPSINEARNKSDAKASNGVEEVKFITNTNYNKTEGRGILRRFSSKESSATQKRPDSFLQDLQSFNFNEASDIATPNSTCSVDGSRKFYKSKKIKPNNLSFNLTPDTNAPVARVDSFCLKRQKDFQTDPKCQNLYASDTNILQSDRRNTQSRTGLSRKLLRLNSFKLGLGQSGTRSARTADATNISIAHETTSTPSGNDNKHTFYNINSRNNQKEIDKTNRCGDRENVAKNIDSNNTNINNNLNSHKDCINQNSLICSSISINSPSTSAAPRAAIRTNPWIRSYRSAIRLPSLAQATGPFQDDCSPMSPGARNVGVTPGEFPGPSPVSRKYYRSASCMTERFCSSSEVPGGIGCISSRVNPCRNDVSEYRGFSNEPGSGFHLDRSSSQAIGSSADFAAFRPSLLAEPVHEEAIDIISESRATNQSAPSPPETLAKPIDHLEDSFHSFTSSGYGSCSVNSSDNMHPQSSDTTDNSPDDSLGLSDFETSQLLQTLDTGYNLVDSLTHSSHTNNANNYELQHDTPSISLKREIMACWQDQRFESYVNSVPITVPPTVRQEPISDDELPYIVICQPECSSPHDISLYNSGSDFVLAHEISTEPDIAFENGSLRSEETKIFQNNSAGNEFTKAEHSLDDNGSSSASYPGQISPRSKRRLFQMQNRKMNNVKESDISTKSYEMDNITETVSNSKNFKVDDENSTCSNESSINITLSSSSESNDNVADEIYKRYLTKNDRNVKKCQIVRPLGFASSVKTKVSHFENYAKQTMDTDEPESKAPLSNSLSSHIEPKNMIENYSYSLYSKAEKPLKNDNRSYNSVKSTQINSSLNEPLLDNNGNIISSEDSVDQTAYHDILQSAQELKDLSPSAEPANSFPLTAQPNSSEDRARPLKRAITLHPTQVSPIQIDSLTPNTTREKFNFSKTITESQNFNHKMEAQTGQTQEKLSAEAPLSEIDEMLNALAAKRAAFVALVAQSQAEQRVVTEARTHITRHAASLRKVRRFEIDL